MFTRIIPTLFIFGLFFVHSHVRAGTGDDNHRILISEDRIVLLSADVLQKQIRIDGTNLHVDSYQLNGQSLLGDTAFEICMQISKAFPNEKPLGIDETQADEIQQKAATQNKTDALEVSGGAGVIQQNVTWTNPITLQSNNWNDIFRKVHCIISQPKTGTQRLNIRLATLDHPALPDLTVNIYYELYENYPAIRKWVEISNHSVNWLKIDKLLLDGLVVSGNFQTVTDLTPIELGATSSIRSYGTSDHSAGIIIGSEVPSAIRVITPEGRTGYSEAYFEWVIGPAERFVSEPVFHYGYFGETRPTISAVSTTLDRTIERPFRSFLYDCVGIKQFDASRFVPLWCSWTNFMSNVNEHNIAEMAQLAARCGFHGFLIDAGWGTSFSKVFAPASIIPDKKKFPDFEMMSEKIRSQGLAFGLWVSCFRHPTFDPDLTAMPDAFSLPKIKRDEGLAMSYASQWRYYYADDLLKLRDQFGVTYLKQDFTNIKFGDIACSHDSRTLKESYLRGLRGLFEAQDLIAEAAPDINIQLTHEIYWGTPGVPCDIAALKHAHTYHIPPNDYSGAGNRGQRVRDEWVDNPNFTPEKLQSELIRGCWNARNRFYAHRALPLQSIEYYGAATVNVRGSLTPDIQRRQICSWLLGTPNVFAGDLASLTEENIKTYQTCFSMLDEINGKYGIYRHFQYSGVPAPTDDDWHWWGKLNEEGTGVVVVIRGRGGENTRKINIPWVEQDKQYRVFSRFSGRLIGNYAGHELIDGKLQITLPSFGQDIIEISF